MRPQRIIITAVATASLAGGLGGTAFSLAAAQATPAVLATHYSPAQPGTLPGDSQPASIGWDPAQPYDTWTGPSGIMQD